MLSNIREDEIPELLERLNLSHATQSGTGSSSGQGQMDPNQAAQVAAMLNDRARLEREQQDFDALEGLQQTDSNAQVTADRLRQFQDLRNDYQTNHGLTSPEEVVRSIEHAPKQRFSKPSGASDHDIAASEKLLEQSITQQVQAAVTAKASAQQTTWTRVDTGTMQPIVPPPQSSSPMPAPIAQRKQNVADTLVARSRSQTPSLETPSTSIAPWAKESVEATKGPSLREIQAAEAKRAAQLEGIASAARRAALAKELAAQEAVVPPQPGLPSSSTWANLSPSAVNPSSSVWSKAGATKTTVPTVSAKKTLQQIQKEEEARKQRVASSASAANSAGSAQPLSSGKRYAELASKVAPVSAGPMAPGGAWTTVGASGKVKTPIPASSGAGIRSVSGGIPITTQIPTKPKQPIRSTTMGAAQLGRIDANEEFKKWAVKELGSHLNKGINGEFDAFGRYRQGHVD
jgi:PERQ amino acid-rich with GYF domain-containing protein